MLVCSNLCSHLDAAAGAWQRAQVATKATKNAIFMAMVVSEMVCGLSRLERRQM